MTAIERSAYSLAVVGAPGVRSKGVLKEEKEVPGCLGSG
jgi:hypothetical protein